VAKTRLTALAIACGTSHGAYSLAATTGDILAMDRIEAIHEKIPQYPPGHARLVSGAQDICRSHHENGGRDASNLWRAGRRNCARIKHGCAQGEHRHRSGASAISGQMRRGRKGNAREFDPRKFAIAGMDEVTKPLPYSLMEPFGHSRQCKQDQTDSRKNDHGNSVILTDRSNSRPAR